MFYIGSVLRTACIASALPQLDTAHTSGTPKCSCMCVGHKPRADSSRGFSGPAATAVAAAALTGPSRSQPRCSTSNPGNQQQQEAAAAAGGGAAPIQCYCAGGVPHAQPQQADAAVQHHHAGVAVAGCCKTDSLAATLGLNNEHLYPSATAAGAA